MSRHLHGPLFVAGGAAEPRLRPAARLGGGHVSGRVEGTEAHSRRGPPLRTPFSPHRGPKARQPGSRYDAMVDIDEGNIERLQDLGDFWFEECGDAAANLLTGRYDGPSLDRIDP